MLALPPAPRAAPRRQHLVGTALVCSAGTMLIGSMLALWMRFRDEAESQNLHWLPKKVSVPGVPTNIMLMAFLPACIFAQWAVYAARRNDKSHVGLALGLVALMGVAIINAQAFVYASMKVPAKGGAYNSMFYALTGVFMILLIAGVAFTVTTAFRYLGGRTTDREIVAAHAIYWYFLAVAFVALWLVVYVAK